MKREVFFEAITDAVASAEQHTSVEVVVSLRHRSGTYRDVNLLLALVGGLTALAWTLYSPVAVAPQWVLPDTIIGAVLMGLLPVVWPGLLRFVTLPGRRKHLVLDAARAEFVAAGVSHTRDRSGILVYGSWIEKQIVVVPDWGVEQHLPADKLAGLRERLQATISGRAFEDLLVAEIAAIGPLCEPHLPRRVDDENELADSPRTQGL